MAQYTYQSKQPDGTWQTFTRDLSDAAYQRMSTDATNYSFSGGATTPTNPTPTQPTNTGTYVPEVNNLSQFTPEQLTKTGSDYYVNQGVLGQKVASPSQLEGYTESDIYRLGSDIYFRPVTPTPYTPADDNLPLGDVTSDLTTDDLGKSMVSPLSVLSDNADNVNAFRNNLANTTNSFLEGLTQEIASIRNQMLLINQQQQQREQELVDKYEGMLEDTAQISLYDTADDLIKRFEVEANMGLYQDLQIQAVEASKIMQDAIDNYDTTTYLTSVVGARQNQLYRQGMNVITSIQATAEIVKGNVDMAMNYVGQMVGYLETDRNTQLATYGALLDLHNNNLITLKTDEKELIEANIDLLQKEADRIERDSETVFELYQSDPYIANQAGVYFTDTPEEAYRKIGEFLRKNPSYYADAIMTFTRTDSEGNAYEVAKNKYTGETIWEEKTGEGTFDDTAPTVRQIGGADYQWNPKTQSWDKINVPAEIDQAAIDAAQGELNNINDLLDHEGMTGTVGAYSIARWTPLSADKPEKNAFLGGVNQLIAQKTLNTLLELKKGGGTLGALSDQERIMLQNAATKIGTWGRDKDGDGKYDFFEIDEATFKKELETMKMLAERAIERAGGSAEFQSLDEYYNYANDEERAKIEQLIEENPDLTDEEILQVVQPFSNDLSKSQNYLGNYGGVTGFGSSYWKYGLDVDLQKGDPVYAPVSGTVIAVGNNGGFGNQVKIGTADGKQYWLSHLEGATVKVGDKITAGSLVGTGGNTGKTIAMSGGDGSHLDITVVDSSGRYLSAREVYNLLS